MTNAELDFAASWPGYPPSPADLEEFEASYGLSPSSDDTPTPAEELPEDALLPF